MNAITSFTRKLVLPTLMLVGALLAPGLVAAAGLLTPADGSGAKLDIREHHVDVGDLASDAFGLDALKGPDIAIEQAMRLAGTGALGAGSRREACARATGIGR